MSSGRGSISRRDVLRAPALLTLGASLQPSGKVDAGDTKAGGKVTDRPNLILFVPDEMRADALGCYGNPVVKTPHIDHLARGGTRFAQCHVQFPDCGQSRCSALTGWPTSVRGHRSLNYFLRPYEPNLFRYLRQAGYDVFLFGKNDVLAAETFYESLTEWSTPEYPEAKRWAVMAPQYPQTMLLPPGGDRRQTSDYAIVQMASKVLGRRETERPFCLFLALTEPHPPYTVPADFYYLYRPADVPAPVPPGLPGRPEFHTALRAISGLEQVTQDEFRKVRAVYYGQVSYSDWVLGELMESLQRTGRDRDTAVLLFSDHGDYAGDYGLVEKWPSGLEDVLTHVPLIARIPGGEAGNVSSGLVELFDVMASCLDLACTRATHTNFSRSLLAQMRGATGDPDRAAFAEAGYNTYEPQAFDPVVEGPFYGPKTRLENDRPETVSRCAAIRTDRYKYIARPNGQSELYDCANDPSQQHNLFGENSVRGVQAYLQVRLMNWYVNTSGVPPVDRDQRVAPPFDPGGQFRHLNLPDLSTLLDH